VSGYSEKKYGGESKSGSRLEAVLLPERRKGGCSTKGKRKALKSRKRETPGKWARKREAPSRLKKKRGTGFGLERLEPDGTSRRGCQFLRGQGGTAL